MHLIYDSKQPAKVALTFPPGAVVDVPDDVGTHLLLDPHWKPAPQPEPAKRARKPKRDDAAE